MKRLLGLLVGLVAVAGIIGLAYGGVTDSIDIKVTLASDVQVDITETEYNFGILPGGETSVSGTGATVTNTSSSNREDYQLNLANPGVWTAITTGSPGDDEYMLMAQFSDSTPASWASADHALSTSATDCSLDKFGNTVYAQSGLDVPLSAPTRYLWFRITMPLSSAEVTERTIPVTVTAAIG